MNRPRLIVSEWSGYPWLALWDRWVEPVGACPPCLERVGGEALEPGDESRLRVVRVQEDLDPGGKARWVILVDRETGPADPAIQEWLGRFAPGPRDHGGQAFGGKR
ncbi:MAG TPA: hypothetical protein GXX55_01375 [Firmicutes bacterium]|nr:hypothetical protein [Bacillota bacterium]